MIAINIITKQDSQVLPLLAEHRYTFKAYKATLDVIQAYEVGGAPSEYVIDRQGRIVAMIRLNSDQKEREFAEMIEKLNR